MRGIITSIAILFTVVLLSPAFADEMMLPPTVWTVCSPSGEFCARLDPAENNIQAYRKADEGTVLWTAPGWTRVAVLADDGEHLVLGYEGMNLIPVDYDEGMAMLTFFRRGRQIAVVRLRDLTSWLRLQRTVSHYYWGDYLGLDADGRYVVKLSRGGKIRFDMTTGKRVQ